MSVWLTSLFANPWMLLWMPAVAAPLVIHLWYRQRYREISWAAMEYLLAAIEKSSRRMRIEQWLLLLVRTLLILLLILALAEPLLRNFSPLAVSEGRTHHLFLLDNSYSMGFRREGSTEFERAKRQIAERVRAGQNGDGYSLILMGDRAEVIIGRPSQDSEQFLAELENLALGQGGADLAAALAVAQNILAEAEKADYFKGHQLTILSDLGRTTWTEKVRNPTAPGPLQERLAQLAEGGEIELVAIGSGGRDNLAVVDLVAQPQVATVAKPTQFIATLHPFTTRSLRGQEVQLWIDGVRVDQKMVDLPAGVDSQVSFTHQFIDSEPHVVSVRTAEDQLPIDNQRFMALAVKDKIKILLVRGKRGSTLPLVAAIEGDDPTIGSAKPEVIDESRLAEIDLTDYDVVFLCNVAQWTSQEAARLREYVEQGGGIVTILGDQVLADQYNREFNETGGQQDPAGRMRPSGFLPAKLGDLFFDETYHFPDPKEYTHPMLSAWKGNPRTGLTSVPVLQYFRLQVSEESGSDTILWLDTGDPLLVLSRLGSGWSLLLATDPTDSSRIATQADRSWSLIASWLNAQPFFEGLWQAVIGGRRSERNREVGQWLSGTLQSADTSQAVVLEMPTQPPREVKLAVGADANWSFGDTAWRGIYRVQQRKRGAVDAGGQMEDLGEGANPADQVFAVNLNARESDLSRLSLADLSSVWRQYVGEQTAAVVSEQLAKQPLGMVFLWLVLFLLFLETFLAWWIGNRFA